MKIKNYDEIIVLGDSYSTGYEFLDHIIMTPTEIKLWEKSKEDIAWRHRAEACKRYYQKITGLDVKPSASESEYYQFLLDSMHFVECQEKIFSWPSVLDSKFSDTSVTNLAQSGNSYYSNVQILTNFLHNKVTKKLLVINQIPSHYRVPIWLENMSKHKDVGIGCLRNDRLIYKLRLWLKNKYKNNQELQYIKLYKQVVKHEKFDSYMADAHKLFLNLEKKYNFKSFYITGQKKTAVYLQTKFNLDEKFLIKDNLYEWGMANFKVGRTHPKDLKYNQKLINLIINKLEKEGIVDTN